MLQVSNVGVVEYLLVRQCFKLINFRLDEVSLCPLRKVAVLDDSAAQLVGNVRPEPITLLENFLDNGLCLLILQVEKGGHLRSFGLAGILRLHNTHQSVNKALVVILIYTLKSLLHQLSNLELSERAQIRYHFWPRR